MAEWHELVTSALLGTERRPPKLAADEPRLLAQVSPDDDAQALLLAAAVQALQRRAGYLPARDESPLPSAPDATLPVCSRRALVHLGEILGNRHYSLLAEWMTGIARRRQRVPFAVIPQVFDMVVQWRDLAPLAALVGDERGRWLALQHGPWRFIGEVDLNEAWAAANAPSSELSMDEALQAFQPPAGAARPETVKQLDRGRVLASADVAVAVLDRLLVKPGAPLPAANLQALVSLGLRLSFALLGPATARLRLAYAAGAKILEDTLDLYEFRAEMLRELDRD